MLLFQQQVLLPVLEEQEKEAADKAKRDKDRRIERKGKRGQRQAGSKRKKDEDRSKPGPSEPSTKKARKQKEPSEEDLFSDPHHVTSASTVS